MGTIVHEMLEAREAFAPRYKGGKGLVDNEHTGFAIAQNEVDFRRGKTGIDGHDDRPHAGAGVVEFEVAMAIEHEHRHPLAALHPQMRQSACQTICAVRKLTPGILGLSTGDGRAVAGYFHDVFKSLGDIHLHVPFVENCYTLSVVHLLTFDCSSFSPVEGTFLLNSLPGWRAQHIRKRTYSDYLFLRRQENRAKGVP